MATSHFEHILAEDYFSPDSVEQVLVLADDMLQESLLEPCDLAGLHLVQVTSDTGIDDCYLLLNGHGTWGRGFSLAFKNTHTHTIPALYLLSIYWQIETRNNG